MNEERKEMCVCVCIESRDANRWFSNGVLDDTKEPRRFAITRIGLGRFHAGYSLRESSGCRFAKG